MDRDIHAILAKIADGNMDAFGELYDLLSERVFNYARTITKSREMAEDITHDVFIQTHKYALRISKVSNPTAYIMAAARNHSYNMQKRENRFFFFDDEIFDSSVFESPDEEALLSDAIKALPPNQRETIFLHLVCGYKHKEIAAIQNVPLITAKWRYRKALSSLRESFTQNEEEETYNERI